MSPQDVHEVVDVTLAILASEVAWLAVIHGGRWLARQWRTWRSQGVSR